MTEIEAIQEVTREQVGKTCPVCKRCGVELSSNVEITLEYCCVCEIRNIRDEWDDPQPAGEVGE